MQSCFVSRECDTSWDLTKRFGLILWSRVFRMSSGILWLMMSQTFLMRHARLVTMDGSSRTQACTTHNAACPLVRDMLYTWRALPRAGTLFGPTHIVHVDLIAFPWRQTDQGGMWINMLKCHVGGCWHTLEGGELKRQIISLGGCTPKRCWVSRACTIGKSLRVLWCLKAFLMSIKSLMCLGLSVSCVL